MLTLKNIVKTYRTGDESVRALRGVDISFRKSEFVCILGHSGCGKTTLLNIVGGLDRFDDGDLIINGKSTKDFKDRDWDSYRNHSIGFVFQSYNLIEHQSVLSNVELALTLSGVSKAQRKNKAIEALNKVGLGDQLRKKPNQMSGGQMQRVAIARALVNDPEILLADEPTGALDTDTSVQIMDILKEVSKDRLVIMVTHNPELAERYATRIVRLVDGNVTDDSDPYTPEDIEVKKPSKKEKRTQKTSMSFFTSLSLSLNNLLTKKARTILTSFAGSIGIIGIALIFAISQGMTTYIDTVQESTLSAYPLTIESSTVELTSLMTAFMDVATSDPTHENDAVYKKAAMYDIINAVNNIDEIENDLTSFKKHLTEQINTAGSPLSTAVNGVQYSYDLDMLIYTKNVDNEIIRCDTQQIMQELIVKYMNIDMSAMSSMSSMTSMSPMASMSPMSTGLWQEMLSGNDGAPINDLILNQYDMVYGAWPNSYDEIVLVLDENNELDDVTLFALGLLPQEDIDALADAALNGTQLENKEMKWTYEEICGREYKTVLNADCYSYDENTGIYTDLRESSAGLRYLYDNALSLKVTGIIRPNEDSNTAMLTGSICYTSDLTKYLIEKSKDSAVIKAQLENPDTDILTGLPFDSTSGTFTDIEKQVKVKEYLNSLNTADKAQAYIDINSIAPQELIDTQVSTILSSMTREQMQAQLVSALGEEMSVSKQEIEDYLTSMSDDEFNEIFTAAITEQVKTQYAEQVKAQLSVMTPAQLSAALDMAMPTYTTEQFAVFYDEIIEFSKSTYEDNLLNMGYIDLEAPSAINIYASSFENKDVITDAIATYNSTVDEMQEIKYTDYIGLMMSSITTIINAITYVLIAFVAISLIVSSIMIGVITLISVQERTKEIGILRAIGASKSDVSGMFIAETMIVGLASGLLGVGVTYLLCIPINLLLHAITGINILNAILPINVAGILVLISMLLTLFSGLIPSRSAAKKDPVVALRTE